MNEALNPADEILSKKVKPGSTRPEVGSILETGYFDQLL